MDFKTPISTKDHMSAKSKDSTYEETIEVPDISERY